MDKVKSSTYHFNRIQFTVELQKKDAFMTCILNDCLKHRWLVGKVILLAQEASHAAGFIFPWADGTALHS